MDGGYKMDTCRTIWADVLLACSHVGQLLGMLVRIYIYKKYQYHLTWQNPKVMVNEHLKCISYVIKRNQGVHLVSEIHCNFTSFRADLTAGVPPCLPGPAGK